MAEFGFCMIEQFVKSTRVGNEDFQMLGGLTTHDEQLPSQGLGSPICNPSSLGVCLVSNWIQGDRITPNKQTTATCAVFDDPYQLPVIGADVYVRQVEKRIV